VLYYYYVLIVILSSFVSNRITIVAHNLQNKRNYDGQAMNITYKYEKLHVKERYKKNSFTKISKNLAIYTDLKIILLDYQNNYLTSQTNCSIFFKVFAHA